MKCIRYGPHAFLLQFADRVGEESFVRCRAIVAALEKHPPPGLSEIVPAFTTVLLEFDPHEEIHLESVADDLVRRLQRAAAVKMPEAPPREIPVVYDGPDLERVAEACRLTIDEVCALHAEPVYKVYMLGFSPGFPYLGDLNPRLHTPRLDSPRPRIPAGSVAIGGEHTGIYSVNSPGGWNIIGRTSVRLFDPAPRPPGEEEAMFLLRAGDRIRFVTVAEVQP